MTGTPRRLVAIIGGGFTGAAVAYHLARALPDGEAEIVVVEPRGSLGAGLAYSTPEPAHRINVPAAKMSLDSLEPEQFSRWLDARDLPAGDEAARTAKGDAFPQRGLFGRYVADMLQPAIREGRIRHLRDRAARVTRRADGGFCVALRRNPAFRADIVALATTHPLPGVPAPLKAVEGSPRFIADPYDSERLSRIDPDAEILVVGNGLTAADIVAALDRRGHRGPVSTLSRHGLRSRGHAPMAVEPFGDFAAEPAGTARQLLARIRRTVAEAEDAGLGWHPVLDTVRSQGGAIWRALPVPERGKLVRHLRSFWDVHRFRIAPQVEDVLDRLARAGQLRNVAATLRSARDVDGRLEVAFRHRRSATIETGRFDVVINTTGPAHRSVVEKDPARSLFEAGLVDIDAVGLGLATAADGRSIGRDGSRVPDLFIAGPLARGTFGELMGLLEVTRYAQFVASEIADEIKRRHAMPSAGKAASTPGSSVSRRERGAVSSRSHAVSG